MSIDVAAPAPKLSKEEKEAKRARKEAKRAKKAAESAATSVAASGTSTPVPEVGAGSDVKESKESKEDKKRRKQEKKRKRVAEAGDASAASAVTADSTAAPTPAPEPQPEVEVDVNVEVEAAAPSEERPGKKSKKDKKAKSAGAEVGSSEPAPAFTEDAPSAAGPSSASLAPSPFTSSHDAYLASQNVTLEPRLFPPLLSIPTLPVHPSILSWLGKFKSPTPIQACSWPALLGARDVIAIAETGSGKTLGFGVPGLNLLSGLSGGPAGASKKELKKNKKKAAAGKGSNVQMLVLAPTRELALQSHETLGELGKALGIASVCLYGGVGKYEQLADLAKPESRIVVGTPGRVLDLANSGDMDLSNVKYLVLDEADRMLDQGFENDIRRIIAHTPTDDRQTVMFSATWPESVRRLASTFLRNPVRITVGSDELSANKRIEQIVEVLDSSRDKDPRMLHHLRAHLKAHPSTPEAPTRILVFALYKKEAQRLEGTIGRNRFSVGALHGDMGQNERFKALDSFKRGDVNVLVATDVAARGLDIPDVGLVLNVTFPLTTEDFVHRCGRTGRAGKSGKAVTFFTGENHERSLAGEFMRVLRDVGADIPEKMDRFPSTIKKKEHGSYGAFYKDTTNAPAATKITFD